jgi:hypothetical protein
MAKPKEFTRPPKKSKAKAAEPQTADDFQEAADLEEETGGKWRAGDPAKSGRAFVRALEIYDRGIQRHPHSFDLAYNKARLELEITQQPALVAHIGLPLLDLLKQTLDSHRYALRLNEQNPDVLFNTSQVLTSLAEQLSGAGDEASAVSLLQEALELLSACLSRQEMLLEQQQADIDALEDGGVQLDPDEKPASTVGSEESGELATVESPVTAGDLLDTIHASLSALTTLVALVEHHALDALGEMAQSLTESKAPAYLATLPTADQESSTFTLAIDRANFVAALADAQFNAYMLDADTYVRRLDDVFVIPNKESFATSLDAEAEARTELALSVLSRYEGNVAAVPAEVLWQQLKVAQTLYTASTKLERFAQVYLSRGDVEMLRHRVATLPLPVKLSDAVRTSAPTLAQNAETYYRGAVKLASVDDQDLAIKAKARLEVAGMVRSVLYDVTMEGKVNREGFEQLQHCVEDGLLDSAMAEAIVRQSVR